MAKTVEIKTGVHFYCPIALYKEVKILLFDPRVGRTKYGGMTALITALLREWVETQRKTLRETQEPGQ